VAKSILSENDSPDLPFRWSVNPYRGCQHACAYCYARPYHEYLGLGAGTDFETKLVVKVNAPQLLAAAFAKPSWKRESVNFSGITDCYQPLEAVWSITRRCLEVCLDYRNPAVVVTKSFLVMRDADVLAELDREAGAMVYLSITFADDAQARLIEPQTPPPSRRFEAIRRLRQAGVPVGVLVAPIIPGLNDRDIPQILQRAADAGAQRAGYIALRLPGPVEQVFLARLEKVMPDRAKRIENRLRDIRGGRLDDSAFGRRMRGQGVYWDSVRRLFEMSLRLHGLDKASAPQPGCAGADRRRRDEQLTLDF
jgi:DNA repair photolyase